MIIDLNGKSALVCGASEGIGASIAIQLAKSGADVAIAARNEDKMRKLISDNELDDKIIYIPVDLQNSYKAVADIKDFFGGSIDMDILVNNTGGPAPGSAFDAKPADFLEAFERHLFASSLLTKEVVPYMKSNNYGRIINIISVSVKQPIDNLGVSNTLRGAMAAWAKTLSKELGGFGITVNNLLPGQTKTARLDALISNTALKNGKSIEETENELLSKIPAGRFGLAEEFGYAAAFLASDKAGFINGVSLPLDGGFLSCI